ncbi:MAG TPA: TIGR03089 family protein [Marmoricola sp.]|nr:TIGR03089 family protein [Marmoricola sp.]
MTAARTFPDLLATLLRDNPSRPLVTAYDDATGERTELSVTTYANWVAKTANLFVDELMLDAGDTILLDLPPHWLGAVFLGGAWAAGLAVTTDPEVEAAAVVCGPDDLEHRPRSASGAPVVACSLLPFAVRFRDPLPDRVQDHGLLWPGQSDVFSPATPVTPDAPAWQPDGLTQEELLTRAAAGQDATDASEVRLLTDAAPTWDAGVPAFLAPLLSGGSLVLVRRPDDTQWSQHRDAERATAELRLLPQAPRTRD